MSTESMLSNMNDECQVMCRTDVCLCENIHTVGSRSDGGGRLKDCLDALWVISEGQRGRRNGWGKSKQHNSERKMCLDSEW